MTDSTHTETERRSEADSQREFRAAISNADRVIVETRNALGEFDSQVFQAADLAINLEPVEAHVAAKHGEIAKEVAKAIREGSSDETFKVDRVYHSDGLFNNMMRRGYSRLLDEGVAPEQARMVLPQSTMTEWHWSGSLDAFADMCKLRCKPDTQYETRLVANQINEEMTKLFPVSWDALIGLIGEDK